jgi:hypothetical protein
MLKLTEVSEVRKAVLTSETSVNFNVTTRRYIPEDCKIHNRSRENLKSNNLKVVREPVVFHSMSE